MQFVPFPCFHLPAALPFSRGAVDAVAGIGVVALVIKPELDEGLGFGGGGCHQGGIDEAFAVTSARAMEDDGKHNRDGSSW